MQINIRGHQTEVQPRWKIHILDRVSKLERFEQKIIKIEFTLTSSHHHLKGNEECKITAKVPRKTINITKSAETMIGAIDICAKIFEQQIHHLYKDIKDRNRHAIQPRTLNGTNS